jgi:hypothetical protein
MRRLMSFAAVPVLTVFSLAAAPSAEPQVQATAVMKSGERHTGTNPRHRPDKGEFALRKSLAEEFRVPGDTVAYIDFGGTPDVDPQISGSQYAVVLRNGTVYRGQLIEMGHTNPSDTSSEYLVIFRDDKGQEHRWPSDQVGRVYLAGGATAGTSGSGSGTTGATAGTGTGLVVSAKQQWTSTGITVRRGEVLTFNATGQIQLSADSNDVAVPAGARTPRYATNAPMPRELAGAIIGRIGNGQPFGIGNLTTVTMPAAGILFLGINDDELNDNSGEFRVEITRSGRRR